MAGEAGILSVTFFKQTFAIYLPAFSPLDGFFIFGSVPFSLCSVLKALCLASRSMTIWPLYLFFCSPQIMTVAPRLQRNYGKTSTVAQRWKEKKKPNSLAERIQASLSSDYRGGQTFQNEAGCLIEPQLIRAPIILSSREHCVEAGLAGQPVVCVSTVRILWRTLTTHGCRDGDVSLHFSPDWMSQQPMDGNQDVKCFMQNSQRMNLPHLIFPPTPQQDKDFWLSEQCRYCTFLETAYLFTFVRVIVPHWHGFTCLSLFHLEKEWMVAGSQARMLQSQWPQFKSAFQHS